MDLDLSMVSEDDAFQCYKTSEEKPVHTNVEDELQLFPRGTNLTPESGITTNLPSDEPHQTVRKTKRTPNAKQTEKLGGIPYYTNNNIKKKIVIVFYREARPVNRINHTMKKKPTVKYGPQITDNGRKPKPNYQPKQSPTTESTWRRGNVECRGQTNSHRLDYHRQRVA